MDWECGALGEKRYVSMAFEGKPEKSYQSEDIEVDGEIRLRCVWRM